MTKKISIQKKDFEEHLSLLTDVMPIYPMLSILENVRLTGDGKTLELMAFNNDTAISVKCNYKGDVIKTLLPFVALKKVLSICGDKIEIELKENLCHITSDNHETVIPTFDYNDYPTLKIVDKPILELDLHKDILSALEKSILFTSKDELRLAITGVCLDVRNSDISIVSTDGQSLFIEQFEIAEDISLQIILPVQGLKHFYGNTRKFTASKNHYELQSDTFKLIGKTIDAQYPEYEDFIPKKEGFISKIGFYKSDFIAAVEKISVLRYDNSNHIVLNYKDNRLCISNSDYHKDRRFLIWIDGKSTGKNQPFEINTTSLIPLLQSLDGEYVYMNFSEGYKSIVISCKGQRRLIMPVRM